MFYGWGKQECELSEGSLFSIVLATSNLFNHLTSLMGYLNSSHTSLSQLSDAMFICVLLFSRAPDDLTPVI